MAMALAVFLARNKYHKSEVGAAMSAFVLHFVAISEGAIPFALADPLRVIPGLMLGGAVGGGLAGLLGVESSIPWGAYVGIWGSNNPLLYLLCMYGGAVVGALAVNFLKKPIPQQVLEAESQEEVVQLFA
jgi:fructose-specific PTS system IIC-like component